MKNILRALFYGKYIPYENITPNKHQEYIVINAKINDEKNYFKNVLSEDNYIRLEKLETMYTESSEIEVEISYLAGFRLATKIMAEVYTDSENLLEIHGVKDKQNIQKIINQLEDLAKDRKAFFRADGDDEVFQQDHDALLKVVEILEKLK